MSESEPTKYNEQAIWNYTVDDEVSPPLIVIGVMVWNGTSWERLTI